MKPSRFNDYDPFAWIYERDWGSDYHDQALRVLDRALLQQLPPRARILDLCCGNGRLTAELARRRYEVTGLDGSEEMLRYARQRAPRVEFLLGDARDFRVARSFDAVISTFDSLNHIPDAAGLRGVFRSVARILDPGGWFVFDVNEEEAYTNLWVWPFTKVSEDRVFIARGTYDTHLRRALCEVTVFRPGDGDGWTRSDFRLTQTLHPEEEIRPLLEREGFGNIEKLDAQRDLGMQGGIGYARSFYRARRP